jgi:hypothetical protein
MSEPEDERSDRQRLRAGPLPEDAEELLGTPYRPAPGGDTRPTSDVDLPANGDHTDEQP